MIDKSKFFFPNLLTERNGPGENALRRREATIQLSRRYSMRSWRKTTNPEQVLAAGGEQCHGPKAMPGRSRCVPRPF